MGEAIEEQRGLIRGHTALLLAVGGVVALIVASGTHVIAGRGLSSAWNFGARREVAFFGYASAVVAIVGLLTQLKVLTLLQHLDWSASKDQDTPAAGVEVTQVSEKSGGAGTGGTEWNKVLNEFETNARKRRAYYVLVSLLIAGFWVIAASYGGYVSAPFGIVFLSTVQFGQIRANRRQDIIILLVVGIAGIAAMDGVTHWSETARLFVQVNENVASTTEAKLGPLVSYNPRDWYPAILVSLLVSSFVNWSTFKAVEEHIGVQHRH